MLALDVGDGSELFRAVAPNQIGAGPTIIDGHVLWGYGYALFGGPGAGGLIDFTVDGEGTMPTAPPDSGSAPDG
jgi:hypothetical protein